MAINLPHISISTSMQFCIGLNSHLGLQSGNEARHIFSLHEAWIDLGGNHITRFVGGSPTRNIRMFDTVSPHIKRFTLEISFVKNVNPTQAFVTWKKNEELSMKKNQPATRNKAWAQGEESDSLAWQQRRSFSQACQGRASRYIQLNTHHALMPETIRATGSVNLGYTYHIYHIYIYLYLTCTEVIFSSTGNTQGFTNGRIVPQAIYIDSNYHSVRSTVPTVLLW